MADPFSAANNMTMAPLEWWNRSEKNKAARAQNATSNKWAPLLALNKSKGKADIPVPSASFMDVFGPAMTSSMNSMNPMQGMSGGKGGGGGGGGGGGYDQGSISNIDGMGGVGDESQAMAGGGDDLGTLGTMFAAGGGRVPKYAGGGMMDTIKPLMSLAPLLLMLAPGGGMVPGKEKVPGDNPVNDTKLVGASPGEVVLPKSVVNDGMKGDHWKVAAYLNEVKKHGPGPLPVKSKGMGMGAAPNKKPSSSMSPWAAMCGGGMTR